MACQFLIVLATLHGQKKFESVVRIILFFYFKILFLDFSLVTKQYLKCLLSFQIRVLSTTDLNPNINHGVE